MDEKTIGGRPVLGIRTGAAAGPLFLQPIDGTDGTMLREEADALYALLPGADFALYAFQVDWQNDLTPWGAPGVFRGQPPFGDGAERTLDYILHELLPHLADGAGPAPAIFLGGYSLAGLFALWAGSHTDRFAGVCAASPSVWYPGFLDHAAAHPLKARAAYLSLGDREEHTKNPVMRTVRQALEKERALLAASGVRTTLVTEQGNHFTDAAGRTARGFKWLYELQAPDTPVAD